MEHGDDIREEGLDLGNEYVCALQPFLTNAESRVMASLMFGAESLRDNGFCCPGYHATIVGKNWVCRLVDDSVMIGRNTDYLDDRTVQAPPVISSNSAIIDLGPSKVVSRKHAQILFNKAERKWELHILGRNGLKVDNKKVKPTGRNPISTLTLNSGNLLDIGGHQMFFLLNSVSPLFSVWTLETLVPKLASAYKLPIDTPLESIIKSREYRDLNPCLHDKQFDELSPTQDQPDSQQQRSFQVPEQISIQNSPLQNRKSVTNADPKDSTLKAGLDTTSFYAQDQTREVTENNDHTTEHEISVPRSPSITTVLETPKIATAKRNPKVARDKRTDHEKPTISYVGMITKAILSTEDGYIALSGIYAYVLDHFPYYKNATTNWKNAIRHTLSIVPEFERSASCDSRSKKWTIREDLKKDFLMKWKIGRVPQNVRAAICKEIRMHLLQHNSLPLPETDERNRILEEYS